MLSCQTGNPEKKDELIRINHIRAPSPDGSSLPYLTRGEDGYTYMSWTEELDSGLTILKYSKLEKNEWSVPELIISGNDWFTNWADYPMIAIDAHGNMIANFLAKSTSGTYSYDVNVVLKSANSNKWSNPIIPHKDGTPTEHGFVTMLPRNDGTFLLAWLDGRNTGATQNGEMTIRSAIIDMEGNLSKEVELDNQVCDCCQTGGVQTSTGSLISYRDRSVFEVRDVSIVRGNNGKWTAPEIVHNDNWKIKGCPVNGPRMDAIGNAVSIAWFTAANGVPKVRFAFSDDAAKTFRKPLEIANTYTLGRVDVAMVDNYSAYVSWLGSSDSTSMIMLRKVNVNGDLEDPIAIAETSALRASGFPQMVNSGKQLILTWTDVQRDKHEIKMATVSLPPN
ncbi:MAG: hypothetical protein GY816_08060 [Cytophagales bacterium]|nr:hypothetical protein [Cytophagales bacterium]